MSETVSPQHTPGPWEVDTNKASKSVIYVFSGRTDLAVMLGRKHPSIDPMIADARLMAAAPEMLDACRAAVRLLEVLNERTGADHGSEVQHQLNGAIAKAMLPGGE